MQQFLYKLMEDGTYCITDYRGDEANIVIPDRYCGAPVTVLFDKLFRNHPEITSIHIPDSVTDIGEFVFDGCVNLRHINLPSQLTNLWGYTFFRCGIEEILLPDKLAALPPFAFKDCKNLKKVVCGSGMKRVYSWVFGGCDQLAEFIHGPNVEVSPKVFDAKI